MRGQSRRKRKREWVYDCNDVGLLFFFGFFWEKGWVGVIFDSRCRYFYETFILYSCLFTFYCLCVSYLCLVSSVRVECGQVFDPQQRKRKEQANHGIHISSLFSPSNKQIEQLDQGATCGQDKWSRCKSCC